MKTGVEVPPTSGSKASGSHWGGNMGQTRGSNSAGQGSLAAPSLNLRFPSHRDSARESAGKLGTPHPIPRLADLVLPLFGVGGKRGTAGKFRDAARSTGTTAARPLVLGPSPPVQPAAGPRAPAPARGGTDAGRGSEGCAGLGRGPAAGQGGHLRVLLGEAVG